MNAYRSLLVGLAALALSATACTAETSVATNPAPPATTVPSGNGTGFYQLVWTVSGSKDPLACSDIGATQMLLTIYTNGTPSTPVAAPCANFNLSVELSPGVYDADAQLVDYNGYAVSQPLALDQLVVRSGTTLTSDADFPGLR